MQHRPEELLEVERIVDYASAAMADMLHASLPHLGHAVLYEWARAEFECAVLDLGELMFSKFGAIG